MGEILQFRLPSGKGEARSPGTDTSSQVPSPSRYKHSANTTEEFASADDPCSWLLDQESLCAERVVTTEVVLGLRVAILTTTDASTDAEVTSLHPQEAVGHCARALVGGLLAMIETIEWETIQTSMGPRILLAFTIIVPDSLPEMACHRVVLRWTGTQRLHAFAFNWINES